MQRRGQLRLPVRPGRPVRLALFAFLGGVLPALRYGGAAPPGHGQDFLAHHVLGGNLQLSPAARRARLEEAWFFLVLAEHAHGLCGGSGGADIGGTGSRGGVRGAKRADDGGCTELSYGH